MLGGVGVGTTGGVDMLLLELPVSMQSASWTGRGVKLGFDGSLILGSASTGTTGGVKMLLFEPPVSAVINMNVVVVGGAGTSGMIVVTKLAPLWLLGDSAMPGKGADAALSTVCASEEQLLDGTNPRERSAVVLGVVVIPKRRGAS